MDEGIKGIFKESIRKVIASINPGTADISDIGDGTIKGAIREQNEKMSDYVKMVAMTMSSTSFAASAQSEVTGDVSSVVPSGYKAITVIPRHSMNANLVWTVCTLSGNTVIVRLRNLSTSAVTAAPVVDILCIRS